MQKRGYLVIFSLLIISMFILAGCKEGAVGGPLGRTQTSTLTKTTEKAAGVVNYGDLVIYVANANSEVYIDSVFQGIITEVNTPYVLPGSTFKDARHTVEIKKYGYKTYKKDVTLRPRQSTLLNFYPVVDRDSGFLDLAVSVGGSIYPKDYPEGDYRITLLNVKPSGEITLDMNGVSQVFSAQQTKVFDGLEITNDAPIYDTERGSFTLLIIKALKTTNSVIPAYKDEHLLRSEGSGEYVMLGGHRISVAKVESGGDVAVEVDGVRNILADQQTVTISGLQITNLDQFYDSNSQKDSSANLLIKVITDLVITGGFIEDVPIGVNIASLNQFNSVLTKNDIKSFFDGQITFGGKSYRTSEKLILNLNKNVSLQTSLTSSDDDYKSDVRLEFEKVSMIYLYSFDDPIVIKEASNTNPLKISFLGKDIEITAMDSPNKIAARVNGSLVTIQDGGKYFGGDNICLNDDPNDPDCWKWVIKYMNRSGVTSFTDTTVNGIEWWKTEGPILALQNDFALNDYKDNPLKSGECASFPNDYLSVCFDSLTTNDADNLRLTFEKDTGFESEAAEAGVSRPVGDIALLISSSVPNSLAIDTSSQYFKSNRIFNNNTRTSKIWLGSLNESNINVYYEDSNGITQLVGVIKNNATFAYIDYNRIKGTSGTSVLLNAKINSANNNLELEVEPADYELLPYSDTLWMNWKYMPTGSLNGLGLMISSEEADELKWESTRIGTKDEDHRTRFGIIIKNPKSGGSSDTVTLEIPNDFMQGNIVIKK